MKIIRLALIPAFFISFLLIHNTALSIAGTDIFCAPSRPCIRRAIELYRDGSLEESLHEFKKISDEGDPSVETGIASFMTGYLMKQLGMAEGEAYFDKAISLSPIIEDYALFMKGEFLEKRGELIEAASVFSEVFSQYPDSVLRKKALLRSGDLYLASGKIEKAIELYKRFLSSYPKDRLTPVVLYELGLAYVLKEELSTAYDYFTRIWIHYPVSKEARKAKNMMEWISNSVQDLGPITYKDLYIRAGRLYDAALYREALIEYRKILSIRDKDIDKNMEMEINFRIAKCLYNLRRSEEAERVMESFLRRYSSYPRASEVLYWLGRNYLRQGKEKEFIRSSHKYIKKYRKNRRVPEVMYRLGIIYSDRGEIKKAISLYNRIMRKYPKSRYASESQWAKGWLFYKRGKFKKALQVFQSIIRDGRPFSDIPRAFYWKAKTLYRLKDRKGMKKTLCNLCRTYRGSFYCTFTTYYYAPSCPAEVSLRDSDREHDAVVMEDGWSDIIRADGDRFDSKIQFLLYLGLKDEALEEIKQSGRIGRMQRDKVVNLANMLYSMGEYYMSLRILYSNLPSSTIYRLGEMNMDIWRLIYPEGYSEVVTTYSETFRLDPFLVYALIREESRFNRKAISPTGAVGLMQLMPKTASTLAGGLTINRESLFVPERNISLGTRYFSALLKRFDGNIILAIAAYNAGPVAVARWVTEREGFDLDEFIEDIPYRETRNYVKRVFKSYVEYHRIKGGNGRIDTL